MVREEVEKFEPLCVASETVKMRQPPWKTVGQFRKRLNVDAPHDPAIPLLGINPREMRTNVPTLNLYTNIHRIIHHIPKAGSNPPTDGNA